jgi:hypothetical protein
MDPDETPNKVREAYADEGHYGLSVWSAAGCTAAQIVQLARSYDDPEGTPPRRYLPHGHIRTSTVGQLRALGFALRPDSPPGHYFLTLPTPPSDADHAALQRAFSDAEPTPVE